MHETSTVLLVAGNGYCCTVVTDADAAVAENKWKPVRQKIEAGSE